jgi:hypothetical protein
MAKGFRIDSTGSFTLKGQRYRIPEEFTDRQLHSYRILLEPIPDQPAGVTLTAAKRRKQEDYFLRRALTVLIPGLTIKTLEKTPMTVVRQIHRWILKHRPQVAVETESLIS